VSEKYDYIVIGGGSGGVASANRAASYGAKVLLIEKGKMGGTCVNVGCVPKKVFWNCSHFFDMDHLKAGYGISSEGKDRLNWNVFRENRERYITRLNGLYEKNLKSNKVDIVEGTAKFVNSTEISVNNKNYSGDKILIAVGGRPKELSIEGAELMDTSNDFFNLIECPKRVAFIGSGFISVELGGVFRSLGASVDILMRRGQLLRHFDKQMGDKLEKMMTDSGVTFHKNINLSKIVKSDSGLSVYTDDGKNLLGEYDIVYSAIGREPATDILDLNAAGVSHKETGEIVVDKYSCTNVENIFAVGDIVGGAQLTPVAIKQGRKLSDRLFGNVEGAFANLDIIPSVIFSHPPIGTIGLSEEKAKEKFGEENIKVYTSKFTNMIYALSEKRIPSFMKLITKGKEERVVGIHCIGHGVDEVIQGFAVAMNMGATKKDFDETVPIHPTAAEELVTMR
jgi:glutathione reductase (NADPH)